MVFKDLDDERDKKGETLQKSLYKEMRYPDFINAFLILIFA